jgi:flagellar M-ring protein FliF
MDWLTTLTSQLQALWSRWDTSQRAMISAAAVICVLTVGGTMYWATRPDYVVLANRLSPQRSAEIVGLLENDQIDSLINFSGSTVSVPRRDVGRARLVLKDVLEPGEREPDAMSAAFPESPGQEGENRRRRQENRLAQSITQILGVRSATVLISQPDSSPFAIEQLPTTASVIIHPVPGGQFTVATAQSIVAIVAQGVEGLSPDEITLVDTNGRQFGGANTASSTMGTQLEYQQRIEAHLAGKAESMLAQMLGYGRATVRVTADIDFRDSTRTELTYDPDLKVKKSETINSTSQSGGLSTAAGLSGADVNVIPNLLDPAGISGGTSKTELNTTEYENASVEETTHDIPGSVKRITVAAIVDLNGGANGADDPAAAPVPGATAEEIEQIIKQAVGFDVARNDEIQVIIAPLQPLAPLIEAPGPMAWWDTYGPAIQWGILGLSVTAFLILGLLLIRRMTPIAVAPSGETSLSLDEMRRLMTLSDQARQNPDLVATILNSWMESPETESQQTSPEQPAAQRRAA